MRAVLVKIEGRVQGVGYRVWTQRTAVSLGLSGWVRNRSDGSVEAHFQGTDQAVAEMITRCKAGPAAAEVTRVAAQEAEPSALVGFDVRATV